MRKVIMVVITVAAMLACITSPLSVFKTLDAIDSLRSASDNYKREEANVSEARTTVNSSINAFKTSREFQIPIEDVDSTVQLLNSIVSTQVKSVLELDQDNYLTELGPRVESAGSEAVRITLVSSDIVATLRAIDRMELAVISMKVNGNSITIDALMGVGV